MNKQHLLLALLVSLSVNLLVAGVLLGRRGAPPPEAPPFAWAAQQLEPATQRLLRQRMRQQLPAVRPVRAEMSRATNAVRLAVDTPDFDPEALARALADMRTATSRYQQLMHEGIVELAKELPREQRVALARSAMQRGERPGPRRSGAPRGDRQGG